MDSLTIEVLPEMFDHEPEIELYTTSVEGKLAGTNTKGQVAQTAAASVVPIEIKLPRQMSPGALEAT